MIILTCIKSSLIALLFTMAVTDQDSSESPMAQSQCENGMFESLLENTRKYTREYFLELKKVVVDNFIYNCNNEILC